MLSNIETQSLFNQIDHERELVALCGWMKVAAIDGCDKVNGDAIFVLTNYCIYVFQYNSSSNLVQRFKKSIVSTSSIFHDGDRKLTINFQKGSSLTVILPSVDLPSIYQMQLASILTESEFPEISSNILIKHDVIPNFMSRFQGFCLNYGYVPEMSIIQGLTEKMRIYPKSFALGDVPGIDALFDVLLISLAVDNRITHLTVNGHPSSPYKSLFEKIKYAPSLRRITLSQPPDQYFPDFIGCLKDTNLTKIDFEGVALTAPALDSVYSLITKKGLKCISFNHVSFDMKEASVLDILSSIVETRQVSTISFVTVRFDKRRDLLDSIFTLKVVSLQGTGMELSHLLKNLSRSQVVSADFTGSKCRKLIDKSVKLNSSITKLVLNHISFTCESLMAIINMVNNHTQSIALSCSFAKMSDEQWDDFFKKNLTFKNISVLMWTENPLCSTFTKLVKKSQIKFLGIGGRTDANPIIEVIEKASSLEYLDISGTRHKLGAEVIRVLKSLKKNIKHVDASRNDIGNDNFQKFYELAENSLDEFVCDNNGFTDGDVYAKLISDAKKKHRKIKTACPYTDYSLSTPGKQSKIKIKDFEAYCSVKSFGSSLAAKEWKNHVIGKVECPIPPEDATDVPMIPAPLSDYEPLVNEKDQQDVEEEKIRNQWQLDVMDIPVANFDEILYELKEKTTYENICQDLLRIGDKDKAN